MEVQASAHSGLDMEHPVDAFILPERKLVLGSSRRLEILRDAHQVWQALVVDILLRSLRLAADLPYRHLSTDLRCSPDPSPAELHRWCLCPALSGRDHHCLLRGYPTPRLCTAETTNRTVAGPGPRAGSLEVLSAPELLRGATVVVGGSLARLERRATVDDAWGSREQLVPGLRYGDGRETDAGRPTSSGNVC